MAAMASASIVFKKTNPRYANLLLEHAQQLFEFGDSYRGKYDDSIRGAKGYYTSVSGYMDELLWVALWLYKATESSFYLNYAIENAYSHGGVTWAIAEFSWDVKYAGLQVLASMIPLEGKSEREKEILREYRSKAEHYVCACMNKNNSTNVRRTPGGLLYTRRWNNMQYVSTAVFLLTVYSDHGQTIRCQEGSVEPDEILDFIDST